jgi:hypothetical protein
MLTLFLVAKIAVILIIVIPLFFLTGPLENPLYELFKLEDSKIKLFVDYLGLHNDWGVFTDGPTMNYWDVRVTGKSDEETHVWYLRRDNYIGNFRLYTDLTKLTIATYYESWGEHCYDTFILNEVKKFFKEKGQNLINLRIDEVLFSSKASDEDIKNRLYPLKVEKRRHWKVKK